MNVTVQFLMQEYRVRESQGEVLVGITIAADSLTGTSINLTIATMEINTTYRALGTTLKFQITEKLLVFACVQLLG